MPNLFGLINIGRDALQVHQRSIDVTNHNIANVNTPGYSRQRAILGTNTPLSTDGLDNKQLGGQYGTGVQIEYVQRVRDMFLDFQVQDALEDQAKWQALEEGMTGIENIFMELGETALNNDLDAFWDSWHDLAQDPTSMVLRQTVIQRGENIASTINRIHDELENLRDTIDDSLKLNIDHVNVLAQRIAQLNTEIMRVEAGGDNANDLRDQREVLVEELSGLVDLEVTEQGDGGMVLSLNEHNLVQDGEVNLLRVNDMGDGILDVVWDRNGYDAEIHSGALGGMIEMRDIIIPKYINKLTEFRDGLATMVNTQHQAGEGLAGTTGIDFFTIDPLNDRMTVSIADAAQLAAAGAGLGTGDNSNAVLMGQMRTQANPLYVRLVGDYANETENARVMVQMKADVAAQLEERRQSVSGVSLDEEMANLVKFQYAYQAAARMITAVDEMIDTVVNGMGLVGR